MKLLFTILLFGICAVSIAEPQIWINQRLADRLSLKAGDSVLLSISGDMKNAKSFQLEGIYSEKPDPYVVPLKRNMIKMHLSDLETLIERPDQLDLISIRVKKGTDSHNLAARLNSEAIGFVAVSSQELADKNSTTFEV